MTLRTCEAPDCDAGVVGHRNRRYCSRRCRERLRRERALSRRQDPAAKEAKAAYDRERYYNRGEREKKLERERRRRQDPAYRKRRRSYDRARRQDPAYRKRRRSYDRARSAKRLERLKWRYHNEPAYRERVLAEQREYRVSGRAPRVCRGCAQTFRPSTRRRHGRLFCSVECRERRWPTCRAWDYNDCENRIPAARLAGSGRRFYCSDECLRTVQAEIRNLSKMRATSRR